MASRACTSKDMRHGVVHILRQRLLTVGAAELATRLRWCKVSSEQSALRGGPKRTDTMEGWNCLRKAFHSGVAMGRGARRGGLSASGSCSLPPCFQGAIRCWPRTYTNGLPYHGLCATERAKRVAGTVAGRARLPMRLSVIHARKRCSSTSRFIGVGCAAQQVRGTFGCVRGGAAGKHLAPLGA